MKKISRDEAIEKGLVRYYTGIECKNGHVCERYTLTCLCTKCSAMHSYKFTKKKIGKIKEIRERIEREKASNLG